ncbi:MULTISPECIES: hypothetical protein [Streptomyces]|uniref:HNH endonuclease n=1 Tax=Streptomyces luteosporeus TaxID=173856 RepID=A0ABN3TTW1_9ACTN
MNTASRRPVPYITAWSAEQPIRAAIIANPRKPGIAYLHETPHDRDTFGVLWGTYGIGRGKGRPLLGTVHPQRQRRAMGSLLCQVCAGPADRIEQGVLWLLDGDVPEREGEITPHPPVCLHCALLAVRFCPELRRGYTAVRVKTPTIDGVLGMTYRPAFPQPVAHVTELVQYTNPASRWVLASQLVATLRGCTTVSLDDLAADHGRRRAALTR